ncbi:hypothetical protein WR25_18278 [Diploscapter pachys]|uniref:Uncharacterized protein n=1 Tax=Diploscapter pachys TaxID=2018661 RepID=A0A2A2KMM3_9BILA|nr:hypothetical protein WR25_18278 [Diploscapter pachys]
MVLGVHLCDPSLPTPPVCKAADAHKQPSLSTQLSTYLTISTRPREDDPLTRQNENCVIAAMASPLDPPICFSRPTKVPRSATVRLSDYLSTSLHTVPGLWGTEFEIPESGVKVGLPRDRNRNSRNSPPTS